MFSYAMKCDVCTTVVSMVNVSEELVAEDIGAFSGWIRIGVNEPYQWAWKRQEDGPRYMETQTVDACSVACARTFLSNLTLIEVPEEESVSE